MRQCETGDTREQKWTKGTRVDMGHKGTQGTKGTEATASKIVVCLCNIYTNAWVKNKDTILFTKSFKLKRKFA